MEAETSGKFLRVDASGEVISLGFGQTGINCLFAFFEEIAKEHNILPGGEELKGRDYNVIDMPNIYFKDNKKPRAIVVDTDSSVLEQLQDSPVGKLMEPSNIINEKEKSEGVFAIKYSEYGQSIIEQTMVSIKKEVEKCVKVSAFQIFHNLGGGVGSGITCGVIRKISEIYKEAKIITHSIIPVLEGEANLALVFNTQICLNTLVDYVHLCIIISNSKLEEYCTSLKIKVEANKFIQQNKIIGRMVADLTAPQRFKGSESSSFKEICQVLVPFPKIKFVCAYVTQANEDTNENILIQQLFKPSSCLAKTVNTDGKFLANYSVYRGNFKQNLLEKAINSKYYACRTCQPVDWSTASLTYNHCRVPGLSGESAVNISNGTYIAEIIARINNNIDILNGEKEDLSKEENDKNGLKRIEYLEKSKKLGLQEEEFSEAREMMDRLLKDYEECGLETQE